MLLGSARIGKSESCTHIERSTAHHGWISVAIFRQQHISTGKSLKMKRTNKDQQIGSNLWIREVTGAEWAICSCFERPVASGEEVGSSSCIKSFCSSQNVMSER